jgi:hypothetical protein
MILIPGMDIDQRSKLCLEIAAIATKLYNIVVVADNKSPFETFYNNQSDLCIALKVCWRSGYCY